MLIRTAQQITDSGHFTAARRGVVSISTADRIDSVNRAIGLWWAEVTDDQHSGYGQTRGTVTATISQEAVALPSDWYRGLAVARPTSGATGEYVTVGLVTPADNLRRDPDDDEIDDKPGDVWIEDGNFVLRPVPTVAEIIKVVYVRTPPQITALTDTLDVISAVGYEALVRLYAAQIVSDPGQRQRHEAAAVAWLAKAGTEDVVRDTSPRFLSRYQERTARRGWPHR